MINNQMAADIAEIKTDIKYIRENMQEIKDNTKRISSLEHSRTWAKATLATTWTAIIFFGWDTIREFFK